MKSSTINRILSFIDKDQRRSGIFLILLMFIASIAELFGLGMVILMINSFLDVKNSLDFPLGNYLETNIKSINSLLILFLIIFTFKFLIMILVVFSESKFMATFRERISFKMFKNFLNRDTTNLLKKNSAEYLRNFTEEITQSNVFYYSLIKIILDTILFVVFVSFLIAYNPIISISAITFFSLASLTYFFIIKEKIAGWSKTALKNRKKRIQFVNESFSAIKFIKILSSENFFLSKFESHNSSLSKIIFKMNFLSLLPRHTYEYILFISILLLIFFLNTQLANEQMIQILSVYTLASLRLIPIINRTLTNSQNIRFTYPSFNKLYIEHNHPVIEKNSKPPIFKFEKKINISFKKFHYENKKEILLKDINLDIYKNKKVGIIGPSGSGKSTLIDIICGFQKLKNGFVASDSKKIHLNLEGWQKNIGYIPQNIVILNQSLKENILFGSNPKFFDNKKIINILKAVELDYFVKKLPKGLNQIIKEDGQNISGGEKQRIGMARALLKNPKILILDEATSGLDTFTESKVLDTINKIKKTIVIVSHRINTLKFCDKVYSIKNNTLKEINISQLN